MYNKHVKIIDETPLSASSVCKFHVVSQDELDRRSRIYQDRLGSSLRETARDIALAWENRQRLISRDIRQDIDPVLELIGREWTAVDLELARFLQELNELGLREALDAVQKAIDMIM